MSRPQSEAEYLARLVPPSVAATSMRRRSVLAGGLGLGAAFGGSALLAACGGSDGPSGSTGPSKQTVAVVQVALSANTLMTGMQAKATATAYDAKNTTVAGRTATWSSDPSGVVSIDAQGAMESVAIFASEWLF